MSYDDNYAPWDAQRKREQRRRQGRSLGDILSETDMSAEERAEVLGGSGGGSGGAGGGVAEFETGWISVPSTRMTDIYYHYIDRSVCVKWIKQGRRGRQWVYRNVPPAVWEDFRDAASKGRFVNLGFTPLGGSPLYDHGPPTAWEASRYF